VAYIFNAISQSESCVAVWIIKAFDAWIIKAFDAWIIKAFDAWIIKAFDAWWLCINRSTKMTSFIPWRIIAR